MPDAHVPPFAKVPFEPFSRAAVVAIALENGGYSGSALLIRKPSQLEP